MRVVTFWAMFHLQLGHEKKALLRTAPTKYGGFSPNWDHAEKVDLKTTVQMVTKSNAFETFLTTKLLQQSLERLRQPSFGTAKIQSK